MRVSAPRRSTADRLARTSIELDRHDMDFGGSVLARRSAGLFETLFLLAEISGQTQLDLVRQGFGEPDLGVALRA